VCVRPGKLLGG